MRPVRRRLLLLGIVPLVLALALTAKVASMLLLDDRGRSAFSSGDVDRARSAFAANAVLNAFEPWVAPFDEGTAAYRLEEYAAARTLLLDALGLVPAEDECLVRINLALTLEALGDASLVDGELDGAAAVWREGVAVLDAGACRTRGSAPAAGLSVAARLTDKLADRADPDGDPTSDPPDPADQSQAEELEQRNDDAQQQHRDNEEVRENEPDPPAPSSPADSEPPEYSW